MVFCRRSRVSSANAAIFSLQEEGICYPPFTESLAKAKTAAEKRIRDAWTAKLAELSAL